MNAPPVDPFEQRLKLRRRQPHHPVLDLGPTELALLEPLGEEAQSRTIPPDQLHPIGPHARRTTPSSIWDKRNWPSSSRLAKKHSPEPSHQISFTRSAQRPRFRI